MIEAIKNRIAELRQSDNNILQEIYATAEWQNHIAHQGGIAELERILATLQPVENTARAGGVLDCTDTP